MLILFKYLIAGDSSRSCMRMLFQCLVMTMCLLEMSCTRLSRGVWHIWLIPTSISGPRMAMLEVIHKK